METESFLLRRLRSLSFSFDLATTVTDWPDLSIHSIPADFAGANDIITKLTNKRKPEILIGSR